MIYENEEQKLELSFTPKDGDLGLLMKDLMAASTAS
jgi:hypothetical protein